MKTVTFLFSLALIIIPTNGEPTAVATPTAEATPKATVKTTVEAIIETKLSFIFDEILKVVAEIFNIDTKVDT